MEHSVIALTGVVESEKTRGFGKGIATVWFKSENEDSFVGIYSFALDPGETTVGALNASATLSFGRLEADFSTKDSHEDIADSYKGTFHNKGASVSYVNTQHVSDTRGVWKGEKLGYHHLDGELP